MMPNSDPRDRYVYPIHKRMLDSFSCILLGESALINQVLPINTLHIYTSAILNKSKKYANIRN